MTILATAIKSPLLQRRWWLANRLCRIETD